MIVNPSYVFGVPVDRTAPGETSTRMIGNYLRGRLPAVVDGETNAVDVRDVAKGHLLAAERGGPGERYVLGGHDLRWVELFERVAELSGVRHPLMVLPPEAAALARAAEAAGLPEPGLRGGPGADGAELALLVGEGAPRARLPRARPSTARSRHDRLVPGADRRAARSAAAARRRCRWPRPGVRLAGARPARSAGCALAERYVGRRLVAP